MKVDFLIAGTQRGGTTALARYLGRHPEICMAKVKEVHFFDKEPLFVRKPVDYSAYHANFDPEPQHRVLGEATPVYMYWHDSPKRIWQYNPAMKIIVTLRNPSERAYSQWNMERCLKGEPLSFRDAVLQERERCRAALPHQHRRFSYVDRGFYSEQIRRLWRYFPPAQVLVLKSRDLRTDPEATVGRICGFLGVRRMKITGSEDANSLPYIAGMDIREKKYLRDLFEIEIRQLERLLNMDFSEWLADK